MKDPHLQQVIEKYLDRDNSGIYDWDGSQPIRTVCKVTKSGNAWKVIERLLHATPFPAVIEEREVVIRRTKDGIRVNLETDYSKESQLVGGTPNELLKEILEDACEWESLAIAYRTRILGDWSHLEYFGKSP